MTNQETNADVATNVARHLSNDQLTSRVIDAVASHTSIGASIADRPFAQPYDGAVHCGQMCRLDDLRGRQRELWANVEAYIVEIHRRLDMTPEERDAEACGLTMDELRAAKAICEGRA